MPRRVFEDRALAAGRRRGGHRRADGPELAGDEVPGPRGAHWLLGARHEPTGLRLRGAAFLSRPELGARALLCALGSGFIGAFVLAAIVLSARATGLGQTLSVLIASQLLVGLLVDRAGLFGASVQDLSAAKVLGAALILVGGVLVVRF